MSSKAFYKSHVDPKLIGRIVHEIAIPRRVVEVWTTTCIVTNFGRKLMMQQDEIGNSQAGRRQRQLPPRRRILVNPCNAQLSGTSKFPYFPRGGPVPKQRVDSSVHKGWQPLGFVSSWGGMEVGEGMLFPVSVVDGLVHQLGGKGLQLECAWKRLQAAGMNEDPCPVGCAVQTSSGTGPLQNEYDVIIHTTPPFYKFYDDGDPCDALMQCYRSALEIVQNETASAGYGNPIVAVPLLGAGGRGFPYDVAIEVAADAVAEWYRPQISVKDTTATMNIMEPHGSDSKESDSVSLAFGVLDESVAEQLVQAIANGNQGQSQI